MSSNFPYIPVGTQLPNPPQNNGELLSWANQFGRAVQHMGRVLATAINSPLVLGPYATGSFTLATGYFALFAGGITLTDGQGITAYGTAEIRVV